MNWSDKYIGLPFKPHGREPDGVDCFGLVWLVYMQELKIELDTYVGQYTSPREHEQVEQLIAGAAQSKDWKLIIDYKPFDVICFRHGAFISHVGIYVHDDLMLHVSSRHPAKLERYTDGVWSPRRAGAYRYVP